MQGHTPHQPNKLLISEERCSEELRSLATRYGWPLLEGIDAISAIHACVAMQPNSVCVEYDKPLSSVTELLRRLSALQSVDRVACLIPSTSTVPEQALALIGTQAFTSADCAAQWLCANTHYKKNNTSAQIWDSFESSRTAPWNVWANRRLYTEPKRAKTS